MITPFPSSRASAPCRLTLSCFIHLFKCSPPQPLSFRGRISLKTMPSVVPPAVARPPQHQDRDLGHLPLLFLHPPMSLHSKSAYGVFNQRLTRSQVNASRCGLSTRGARK